MSVMKDINRLKSENHMMKSHRWSEEDGYFQEVYSVSEMSLYGMPFKSHGNDLEALLRQCRWHPAI
jgi:hypothetical protein